jgi:hypothetical protein
VPFTQAELDELDKIEAEAEAEVKEEYAQMAADEADLYDSDSEDRRGNDDETEPDPDPDYDKSRKHRAYLNSVGVTYRGVREPNSLSTCRSCRTVTYRGAGIQCTGCAKTICNYCGTCECGYTPMSPEDRAMWEEPSDNS